MKYIAYGSNMVEEQMAHRCPGAKLIGTGYLPNHRLEFYLHATAERTRAHGAKVPVAVWEITDADERSLDRYEGYPTYYTKHRHRVVMDDGTELWGDGVHHEHDPTASAHSQLLQCYSQRICETRPALRN